MAEEPSLPYYLPIAGGRIIGFIPFPRVLVLCEMLSVSSRIWTHVAVSISSDDNHYTTDTTKKNNHLMLHLSITLYGFLELNWLCKCILNKKVLPLSHKSCYIYTLDVCIYPTPPPWAGCDIRSFFLFKWSTFGLNSVFLLLELLPYQG